MKTYCGITLGPIVKTLSQARKTRELWSGSYLFSYLMKHLLKELAPAQDQLILPYAGTVSLGLEKVNLLNDPLQAGLFPDRAVFELHKGQKLAHVEKIKDEVVDALVQKVKAHLKHLGNGDDFLEEAETYFKTYLQVYAVAQPFEDGTTKQEIVRTLFARLDVLELQGGIVPLETQAYVQRFMSISTFQSKKKRSFLKEDAGLDADRFESVIEIAARELIDDPTKFIEKMKMADQDLEDDDLVAELKKEHADSFRTHHKYIAIVQLDGDNFGQYIKSLDDGAYQEFTKALARYTLVATRMIDDHGGQPVYLGGDDALFFAPVRNNKGHIFSLLQSIDKLFDECLKEISSPDCKELPTLSAGVAVHYYKFPLTESLERSWQLLVEMAKQYKMANEVKKNAIAIEVQKHSGQTFGLVMHKKAAETSAYRHFLGLLKDNIEDSVFLNSVIQTLSRHKALLDVIGADKARVSDFITNQFNEGIHGQYPNKDFLENLKVFIPAIYNEYPPYDSDSKTDHRADALYGALRLIKFLNRDDNE